LTSRTNFWRISCHSVQYAPVSTSWLQSYVGLQGVSNGWPFSCSLTSAIGAVWMEGLGHERGISITDSNFFLSKIFERLWELEHLMKLVWHVTHHRTTL
jgi:hypothetical protein